MKTLCLYYTRTGTTKEIMESIAKLLDADVAEYTDGKDRSGFFGYLGACFATVKNTKVELKGDIDLAAYDRVIIGMPIWAEGPSAPGRAFIKAYADKLPDNVVYVIAQMGTRDYSKKIKAMDKLLGKPSSGQISIRTKDNDYLKDAADFAKTL